MKFLKLLHNRFTIISTISFVIHIALWMVIEMGYNVTEDAFLIISLVVTPAYLFLMISLTKGSELQNLVVVLLIAISSYSLFLLEEGELNNSLVVLITVISWLVMNYINLSVITLDRLKILGFSVKEIDPMSVDIYQNYKKVGYCINSHTWESGYGNNIVVIDNSEYVDLFKLMDA